MSDRCRCHPWELKLYWASSNPIPHNRVTSTFWRKMYGCSQRMLWSWLLNPKDAPICNYCSTYGENTKRGSFMRFQTFTTMSEICIQIQCFPRRKNKDLKANVFLFLKVFFCSLTFVRWVKAFGGVGFASVRYSWHISLRIWLLKCPWKPEGNWNQRKKYLAKTMYTPPSFWRMIFL